MANEKQPPDRRKKTQPPAPLEEESAPASARANPARPDDIFSTLAEFVSGPIALDLGQKQDNVAPPSPLPAPSPPPTPRNRLSGVQKILLVGIVCIGTVFIYTLITRPKSAPRANRARRPTPPPTVRVPDRQPTVPSDTPVPTPPERPTARETTEPGFGETRALPRPEPLSLQLADRLYEHRDFEPALAMYETLSRRLPATEESQPLADLLLLRMAMCHKNSGGIAAADNLLRTVSLSRLPVLRALARYHQSVILLERQRYLEAATKAWQTMGLIDVIDYDKKWTAAIREQCSLLAAEAMTRNVLALCDADGDLPVQLWAPHPDIDPFVGIDEPQLRVLLASGVEKLEAALLSPQIRAADTHGAVPRWMITCSGAPIEELLARFATHAGLNIQWIDSGRTEPAEDNVRRRPVYLYLASASALEVVTTAAGSVGLLARMDDKGTVQVLDPASYSSLADHTKVLAEEAVLLWRRILLGSEEARHAANSHFAMGLLHTVRGQFDEAMAEYRLVANRFARHDLAPYALLDAGKLKVRLRDYRGAHEDLKQLVELYPESPLADRACLSLAEATMKAGLYEEATGLYHKVYNLGLSVESQMQAALGAGRCFFETKNYEEAANWLNRYVTLERDQNRPEFCGACLVLGKTYLALHKPQQAHAALKLALQGELSRQQHVETIVALAQTCMEQGLLLDALQILEETAGWQLSQQETVELLLLRAQVLRSIGLTEKAIALLAGKSPYLPSPVLKGKVALELARCQAEAGHLESARRILSEAFTMVEASPLAQQIGCELAGTSLLLGQPAQAVALCSQLLEHASPGTRERILDLLARAYRAQGQYERAVAVLLDQYAATTDPNGVASLTTRSVTR
jgi:tetratricopeptide (TPR) repeat protein